jgi:hypothetical protein
VLLEDGIRVPVQKVLREKTQSFLDPDNVIGRQDQVELGTAFVKTGEILVAAKTEGAFHERLEYTFFLRLGHSGLDR